MNLLLATTTKHGGNVMWPKIIFGKPQSVVEPMCTGCPACDGKQLSSTNSLAILHPHLIKEWHPVKNGADAHSMISLLRSGKKVWWKCKLAEDHEWQAFIYTRAEGYGCPFCANRKGSGTTNAVSDTNRLSILYPELVDEWESYQER